MKKIMIIAGGEWQIPITKKAKEMGLYVISTNLYPNSPAFPFADACEIANVLDVEKNLEYAAKYRPDAIITDQSDIAVPTVARICEAKGLAGIGAHKALLFTNKHQMRLFCKSHGFASPDFCLCSTADQAEEFRKKHKKIVIKPLDSQSSRGVFTVESEAELRFHFAEALKYSRGEHAVLAEQFVTGTEFTVDGIQTRDSYYTLAISEKKHYAENPNVAQELFFTQTNEQFDYTLLRRTNDALVCSMGLPFGLTHAEYKYMDGQYYLIEIAARGGGTKISSDIVPLMSGVDSNRALIEMALGNTPSLHPSQTQRCAVLKFLQFAPGTVERIIGLDEIRNLPGVQDIGLNFRAGEEIFPMHDDRSRPGYYIAWADTSAQLHRLQTQIETTLTIKYSNNG